MRISYLSSDVCSSDLSNYLLYVCWIRDRIFCSPPCWLRSKSENRDGTGGWSVVRSWTHLVGHERSWEGARLPGPGRKLGPFACVRDGRCGSGRLAGVSVCDQATQVDPGRRYALANGYPDRPPPRADRKSTRLNSSH